MQSAHGVPLAVPRQEPRRTYQFSSHARGRERASAACAPELRRGRAARPGQRAPKSAAFSDALRQRGTSQSAPASSRSSRRQHAQPAQRRAAQPSSISRTVMRRVSTATTSALHCAARCAPDQAPRASAAHPDDTPRARVPCAACSATALQRAHRPRAAPHHSSPSRAAQRASCLSGAPRLPTRRPACGNESGSFAARRRAHCVPRAAPPPSPPCSRPAARVCSESARGRPERRSSGLRPVSPVSLLQSTRGAEHSDTRRPFLAPAAGDSTPGAGTARGAACNSAGASRRGDKGWLPRQSQCRAAHNLPGRAAARTGL